MREEWQTDGKMVLELEKISLIIFEKNSEKRRGEPYRYQKKDSSWKRYHLTQRLSSPNDSQVDGKLMGVCVASVKGQEL